MANQYTLDDFLALNQGYKKTWDPNTNTGGIINTANNKQINFGINQGQQYGLGNVNANTGSHYINDLYKLVGALGGQPAQQPVQQQYVSPYQSQMQAVTNQVMNRGPFQYNPNTDTALQQAQGQVSRNVMETMNERGILNSTVTGDRVAQEVANLVPQYEQIAYNRYQDETTQLMNKANFINNLDTKSYQQFQDQLQYDFEQKKFEYEKSQNDIANERNRINDAWSKVQNLGYVDNEASIILGVPVGTPSWEAKNAAENRKHDLDLRVQDNDFRMQELDKQHEQDIYLVNLKNQYDKEMASIDAGNQMALENKRFENDKELANIKSENNQFTPAQQASNYNTVYNNAKKMLDGMRENLDVSLEYGPPNPETGLYPGEEQMYEEIIRTIVEDPRLDEEQKATMLNQLGIPEI